MYNEVKYKKRLYRNRPFLLLGNEIDGQLFCDKIFEFKNFSELKEKLPSVLSKIQGEGEWRFELYQVPENYRIWHRYGYYKYPSRGTKLFKYSYMSLPVQDVKFEKREISFVGAETDHYSPSDNEIDVEINRITWDWE